MKRVMIVDDDSLLREVTSECLQKCFDIRATEAESGNQAVALISQSFDDLELIVSDFSMPDGNGQVIFDYLQQNPEISAAFILFTGEVDVARFQEKMIVVRKPGYAELISTIKFLSLLPEK